MQSEENSTTDGHGSEKEFESKEKAHFSVSRLILSWPLF
jgi:hypothetical protein